MRRLKFKETYIIISASVLIKLLLDVIAFRNSFYLGDEFLHIDAGHHLAFGFFDFPPVIAVLAFLQNLFDSDSLIINRLTSLIAGSLIVIFSGLITLKMGGKRNALLLVLACIIFSPGFAGSQILFLPVVFEQLFWIICIYFIVCFCNTGEHRYLIIIAFFAAIGFLTKYSIVFLIGGIFPAVLLTRRELFRKKALWTGMIIFLIMIAPNIWWQYENRFPVLDHMSELYRTQLNRTSFFSEQIQMNLFLNPAIAVF
jgi:4-amino-4-deoxy-L-arabinose transferase-like glycosyltransferase